MSRTHRGLMVLLAALAAATLASWLGASLREDSAIGGALNWTGRMAFLVFLVPFLASPLRSVWTSSLSAGLVRWRREAGIAFGGIQVVHLGLIIWMLSQPEAVADIATLVVGGTGLVLALLMLITSFDAPRSALSGAAWKRLHRAGLYVFTFIYFYDFVVAPVLLEQVVAYLPWMLATLAGLILRTWVWLAPRSTAGSAAAA